MSHKQYTKSGPNLYHKPIVAHSYDDEFESDTLDAAWELWNDTAGASASLSSTPIDFYDTSFSSGTPRYDINATYSQSKLRIQMADNGNLWFLTKPVTLPDVFCLYTRLSQNIDLSQTNYTQPGVDLILCGPRSAAGSDSTHYIVVGLGTESGKVNGHAIMYNGGWTVYNTTDVDNQGQALEYFVAQRTTSGGAVHLWWGTESNWIYAGSITPTFTIQHIGFNFKQNADQNSHIISFDFLRMIETDKFPF